MATATGLILPRSKWASLPSPTQAGVVFLCSDAPGGVALVVSTGSSWLKLALK